MPVNEENSNLVTPPKSLILLCLFNTSRNIMQNAYARTFIYLATISLLMICSLVHLTECVDEENNILEYSSISYSPCLNPWVSFSYLILLFSNNFHFTQAISESVVLTICMSFLFVRIHFVLKLCVSVVIVVIYSWVIFVKFPNIFTVILFCWKNCKPCSRFPLMLKAMLQRILVVDNRTIEVLLSPILYVI